jgi:hypothetical protein
MDILLWIAIIVLILLPPSLDPAIRIKMRQVLRGDHYESPPDMPYFDGADRLAEDGGVPCTRCHDGRELHAMDRCGTCGRMG